MIRKAKRTNTTYSNQSNITFDNNRNISINQPLNEYNRKYVETIIQSSLLYNKQTIQTKYLDDIILNYYLDDDDIKSIWIHKNEKLIKNLFKMKLSYLWNHMFSYSYSYTSKLNYHSKIIIPLDISFGHLGPIEFKILAYRHYRKEINLNTWYTHPNHYQSVRNRNLNHLNINLKPTLASFLRQKQENDNTFDFIDKCYEQINNILFKSSNDQVVHKSNIILDYCRFCTFAPTKPWNPTKKDVDNNRSFNNKYTKCKNICLLENYDSDHDIPHCTYNPHNYNSIQNGSTNENNNNKLYRLTVKPKYYLVSENYKEIIITQFHLINFEIFNEN